MPKAKPAPKPAAKTKPEMVDILDKKDKIFKTMDRAEALKNGLRHRYVQVLVFNQKGEMWVQWRSRNRTICPRQFGGSASGSVMSGETYEQAAHRELKEEMGITKAKIQLIGYRQTEGKTPYNVANFVCQHDIKDPTGWEEEADILDLMTGEEISFLLQRFPYLVSDGLTSALEQLEEAQA